MSFENIMNPFNLKYPVRSKNWNVCIFEHPKIKNQIQRDRQWHEWGHVHGFTAPAIRITHQGGWL
jgi:hypothetical protein